MPPKRLPQAPNPEWFDLLPAAAMFREHRLFPSPDNPTHLVDVDHETWRRWGLRGLAPRARVIGGTRHQNVGEIRRWLRGEWSPSDRGEK